jgi:prophage regulatory protein
VPNTDTPDPCDRTSSNTSLAVIRHREVKQKLKISSAKLFDMVAKGVFPRPFQLIPGGRAVGWLETDVDQWILNQRQRSSGTAK